MDHTNQQINSIHCIITGVSSPDGNGNSGLGYAIAVALGHPKYYTDRYMKNNANNRTDNENSHVRILRINMVLVTRHHANNDNDQSCLQEITNAILQQWRDYYDCNGNKEETKKVNITSSAGSISYCSSDGEGNDEEISSPKIEAISSIMSTIDVCSSSDNASAMKIILHLSQLMVADLGDITTIDNTIDKMIYCWERELQEEKNRISDKVADTCDGKDKSNGSYYQKCHQRQYIVVHNVGTLGYVGCLLTKSSLDTTSVPNVQEMNHAVTLNVTNPIHMTNRLVQWFHGTTTTTTISNHSNASLTIVNISSLCAIQAFPSLAMYSCMKAARDMYHTAIAKEVEGVGTIEIVHGDTETSNRYHDNVRFLNYAPGPLQNTNMTHLLLKKNSNENGNNSKTSGLHSSIQDFYTESNMKQNFVHPNDSAHVLASLLLEQRQKQQTAPCSNMNGVHIDYYDCV